MVTYWNRFNVNTITNFKYRNTPYSIISIVILGGLSVIINGMIVRSKAMEITDNDFEIQQTDREQGTPYNEAGFAIQLSDGVQYKTLR